MTDAPNDLLADDAFVNALLDAIIPPGDGMPGAGSLGLAPELRKGVAANPMFAAPVAAALVVVRDRALTRDSGGLAALSADAREELMAELMAQQPALGMLQLLVFVQYYQSPQALRALGLPGGPPFPDGHEIEPTDPALLEKLAARKTA